MGIEIPEEDIDLLNGTFDDASAWILGPGWFIIPNFARAIWNIQEPFNFIRQNFTLVPNATYKIEFDILTAFSINPNVRLVVDINFPPAPVSEEFNTVGHKIVYLKAKRSFGFVRFRLIHLGVSFVQYDIDNVTMTNPSTNLAFELGFLPLEGVKTDQNSSAVGSSNMLLAHYNGGSNVIFEME